MAKNSELTDRQALREWDVILDNIRKETALSHGETEAQQKRRIKELEAAPELWFKYYFPNYSYAEPAPFHKAATKRVLGNMEWYEVRMWSRELAKSTRTMMEVLFLCLTGKKRYVLMVSNSEDNAERLLSPYRANLQANQRIIHDYGMQEQPGKWQSKEFVTLGGVGFRALGAGQSPRGTRNEEIRPDVILFDDIDTDEECRNPEIIKKKWKWIEEAAIATRSISIPTTVIFCGNRIAPDCCVERATNFADNVDVVNIRDDNGNSSWPQKNSEEDIARVLRQKSYAAQQKEYFNNPVIEGSVFKEMAYKPARHLRDYEILVCYTDPSFKDTRKNDYKATMLVGGYRGEFHIIKAFLEQTTTAKMIEWHYHIMDLVKERTCYYYMEQVFLQDIILKEFYEAGAVRGCTIPIVGDQRQKQDKFTRIEALLEPLNRNGRLFLNADERHNPHMQRLYDQFISLAPGSRAHDDGPDAVEGAVWIINNKIASFTSGDVYTAKRTRSASKHY